MTSLTFMFVDVPEPVWKMSIGNWSSSAPRLDLGGRRGDRRRHLGVDARPVDAGVDARGLGLDPGQGVDHLRRQRPAGDREVVDGEAGLPAPQSGPSGQVRRSVSINPVISRTRRAAAEIPVTTTSTWRSRARLDS